MRILLLSLNYAPEPTGIGLYSGDLAESLAAAGHAVSVVCANPHYPQWELYPGYSATRWTRVRESGVEVTRCPVYVPARPGGLSRIVHYLSFLSSALGPMARAAWRDRPELVICVAPALIAAPAALVAAKIAGAKSWVHVQDFEVEAAFATDHLRAGGVVAKLARAFERAMLGAFDRASSISREMCAKLVEKGRDPATVFELRNWAELAHIRPQQATPYRAEWDIATPHVALYSGSIARKQGIETLVEVARLMETRADLTFVVCGNGPNRADLEARAAGSRNIRFHDLQPKERLGDLLALATVHLLPQRADAADLVLPSKLANMLASGRPVVAGARAGTGLGREVEGAGLTCEPDDGQAMASAIARLLDEPALHAACAAEAERRAHERWSREAIIARFDEEIQFALGKAGRACEEPPAGRSLEPGS